MGEEKKVYYVKTFIGDNAVIVAYFLDGVLTTGASDIIEAKLRDLETEGFVALPARWINMELFPKNSDEIIKISSLETKIE